MTATSESAPTVPVPRNILDMLLTSLVTETADYKMRQGIDGAFVGDPFDLVIEWLVGSGREDQAVAVAADLVRALRELKPEGERPLLSEILPSVALSWPTGGDGSEHERVRVLLRSELPKLCGPHVESR